MKTRRGILLALGAAALAAPLASLAQPSPARIAFIGPGTAAVGAVRMASFRQGMLENGLVEGQHYVMDEVYAGGDSARFPAMTREVLQRNAAVILVSTNESVRVAQALTKTVPIVIAAATDPVGSGLVASLARPGGNTTGLSTQSEDTMTKYIELLRETLPRAKRIAVLMNPANSSNLKRVEQIRVAGGKFGMDARVFEATTPVTLDAAFSAIEKHRPDALLVVRDGTLNVQFKNISAFALRNRIPAFGPTEDYVVAGSLLSYAPSITDMFRRSATFVAKILAGAKPADLPVEQPTKFELVVNAKTAKALGVKIPQSVVHRVDRVIE